MVKKDLYISSVFKILFSFLILTVLSLFTTNKAYASTSSNPHFGFAHGGTNDVNNIINYLNLHPDAPVYAFELDPDPTGGQDRHQTFRRSIDIETWGGGCYPLSNFITFAQQHHGNRYYSFNEPEISAYACWNNSILPVQTMAQKHDYARFRLSAADPTGIMMSPGFSHRAWVDGPPNSGGSKDPVVLAQNQNGVWKPYAEAWIDWMRFFGYPLPTEWTVHIYPRTDDSNVSATTGYNYVKDTANYIRNKLTQMNVTVNRLVISETGWPDRSAVPMATGNYDSTNWSKANEFASLLGNGFKNGDIEVNDIVWFIDRSQTGWGGFCGWGGYLLYSNQDPLLPGQGCTTNYASLYSRTPLGTTWRMLAN